MNCIIVNKLNLVKLSSALLWCMCLCLSLSFYNLRGTSIINVTICEPQFENEIGTLLLKLHCVIIIYKTVQ